MDENRPTTAGHRLAHLGMILGTGVFHITCYKFVNQVTRWASLPIRDFSLVIDRWIPYLGWTWPFYYLGNVYILLGGGVIVWKLPDKKFHRAVGVYLAMILTGAVLQIVLASASPWPPQMIPLQRHLHSSMSLDLYACMPSMHVALTVFTTCLSFSVFRARLIRAILVLLAGLITISTLTFKEHVVLDAVAGILFAALVYGFWLSDGGRKADRKEARPDGS